MLAPQEAHADAARSYVAFRPLGVVLAIMPWNFPYWQVFRAAALALLTGNAMLPKTRWTLRVAEFEIERVFREAGAPDGLFSTLLMTNADVDALIADPRIAAVTLTGSERAGVAVASAAGAALKKCVLELGGSMPSSCSTTPTSNAPPNCGEGALSKRRSELHRRQTLHCRRDRSTTRFSNASSRSPATSAAATRPTRRR